MKGQYLSVLYSYVIFCHSHLRQAFVINRNIRCRHILPGFSFKLYKNEKLQILFFLLAQFVSLLAFPQNRQLRFERIGTKEGLSDPNITCIMQDSRSFLWIGTRYGLNRYDGNKFKVFYSDPKDSASLSNSYITDIIEDSKENIWIATAGSGFNKFDRKKNRFKQYTHQPNNLNSVSNNNINKITEDKKGKLWIATSDGVNIFDPATNHFIRFTNDKNNLHSISDNNVISAFADSYGDIWFGTQTGGLNRFVSKDSIFVRYQADSRNTGSISGNNITAIFEDSNHRLWVGTSSDGLNLFDRETEKFSHFTKPSEASALIGKSILSINEDDIGNLWIGSENGGINIFNYKSQKLSNYTNDNIDDSSLSKNSVYSITKDYNGNMWIGLYGGGINQYKKSMNSFNHFKHNSSPNSLSNNFVLCIYEDKKENLWVGTDGGGLNYFDRETGKSHQFMHHKTENSIAENYVLTLAEDEKDNLWIGTWAGGLSKLNLKTRKFTNFKLTNNNSGLSSNNIYTLAIARDGKVWIGTFNGGLDLYDEQSNRFTHFRYNKDDSTSISSDNVFSLLADKTGRIWIGTFDGGLCLYEPGTNNFTRFNKENKKLINNRVSHIFENKSGIIYACTLGGGINYFDPSSRQFIPIETRNKFASEYIFAALEDLNGEIWASTKQGISKYDPKTKTVKNYTIEDGLQEGEFKPHSAFIAKSGMLYFGGINGYNSFFPEQIIKSSYKSPIVLTDFQLFNKNVPIAQNEKDPSPLKQDISETKSIRLSYDQTFISFEFESLDFSLPSSKVYAYMLEGFDNDWNIVGSKNTATYMNLDPGDYVFKVKSQNRSGEWSSQILKLDITIVPPFWRTWWFKILGLFAFGLAIYIAYYLKLKNYREKQKELSELVIKRTAEITKANKELLERQTLIQNQSEELRVHSENLTEANDLLIQNQTVIKSQSDTIQEANTELIKLNKTKDRILSIIAHDLRNPFNVVSGFSEILLEEYRDLPLETIEMYLTLISNASKNGNILLGNLLQWSRTQTGSITFEPVPLKLRLVAEETYNFLEGDALKKNITVFLKIDSALEIVADDNMVKTILRNLLSNAIKFTREKGIISVSATLSPNQVEICVSDSGVGIPQEKMPLLFRIETNTSTKGTSQESGSGLGLILCKEFVERHGGKIWVESTVGVGTQFKFTLPVKFN